jgi:hypothetical protein
MQACWRALAILLCVLSVAMVPVTAHAEPPKVPEGWKFTLPDGDPAAGKTLYFDRLSCDSCHRLTGAGVAMKPGYGGKGPDLDGYAVLPREYLAEAIIKAHKVVAAPGYAVTEGGAAMGNYNHLLVVQELIDLVAFLRAPAASK